MLTAVVVLPTPPFWFAIAMTRVISGLAPYVWERGELCGLLGSADLTVFDEFQRALFDLPVAPELLGGQPLGLDEYVDALARDAQAVCRLSHGQDSHAG